MSVALVRRLAAVGIPAYPVVQPANTGFPACVYSRVADDTQRALEGATSTSVQYQLDFRARMYSQLTDIVNAAIPALTHEDDETKITIYDGTDLFDDELNIYRRIISADISA